MITLHQISQNAIFTAGYYGKEFDTSAKQRMIYGCKMMQSLLTKYQSQFKGEMVEFGPFRHPLLTPEAFPNARILYVDGDENISEELASRYEDEKKVEVLHLDLNRSENLPLELQQAVGKSNEGAIFQVAVISQVLNYIKYENFFRDLSVVSSTASLLFVNNVIDYGIPELFSIERPRSDQEILNTLRINGWKILEFQSIPSIFLEQKNPRALIVAEKK